MNHNRTYSFWRSVAQCLLGGIAVALLTLVCFRLNVSITTAALLYLIVVVLASLTGNFVLSVVVSIVAILCLDYFFTEPRFTVDLTLREPLNLVALITFLGTALVITSLMSKVRKSFEILREQARLLDLTHDTVFVRDLNDVITYWNRGAEELYGWTREEALGNVTHQLLQTIFPAPLEKIKAELLRTGRWEGDLVHTKRDGTQVTVGSRWSLQRDGQELPNAILETNNDITERRQAEEALREQANLLNLTHDAILVRDLDGVVKYWNRGAEELYGWTADDATGKVTHELLHTIFPAPLAEINAELLRTSRWEGDLVHTKPDGTKLIVASRWALQQRESGNPIAVLEINNDITERKRAEEEIRKLNQELEQRVIERTIELGAVNKELEAFAYSVSHDLRAPLRHMAGYAELLQKSIFSILDEKSRRYMMMILESAKRMGDLIDDLLAFSRIGRAETQKTVVSLEQLVQEALSEVRQETEGRAIGWTIGALPDVNGDRSMLRLALVNLISNAVKFTRRSPQPEIEIGSVDGKDGEIVIFIRDNGVGFDMKYVNKLFGVFQRLHRAEEFEGTGIGLATVQRIIHRHGGRIWAEGLVDRGATFYFSVPKS